MFKKSFFEKLTGGIKLDEEQPNVIPSRTIPVVDGGDNGFPVKDTWVEEAVQDAELTVDVYQTPAEIIVQTMVAGVRPEDLTISITRDMVTIKGKREENKTIAEADYFSRELYWGSFSRTISLPQEVEPDQAEAIEKHGLLIIKLPKIDRKRQATVRVKSI